MQPLYKNNFPNILPGKLWTPLINSQNHSILDITGKKLDTSSKDNFFISASNYLSIYNDNRYETARYLIIKDNIIKDQITISTGIPNSTIIAPQDWMTEKLFYKSQEKDFHILFCHNHPSGIPIPSVNDKAVTNSLYQIFLEPNMKSRFLGHIIISDNSCTFTDGYKKEWKGIYNNKIVNLEELPIVPTKYNTLNIMGSLGNLRMVDYAKAITGICDIDHNNYTYCFYSNAAGYITGIEPKLDGILYANTDDQIQYTKKLMQQNAKKCGACQLNLVNLKEKNDLFDRLENFANKTNIIANNIMLQDDNKVRISNKNHLIFNNGEMVDINFYTSDFERFRLKQEREVKEEVRLANQQLHLKRDRAATKNQPSMEI